MYTFEICDPVTRRYGCSGLLPAGSRLHTADSGPTSPAAQIPTGTDGVRDRVLGSERSGGLGDVDVRPCRCAGVTWRLPWSVYGRVSPDSRSPTSSICSEQCATSSSDLRECNSCAIRQQRRRLEPETRDAVDVQRHQRVLDALLASCM